MKAAANKPATAMLIARMNTAPPIEFSALISKKSSTNEEDVNKPIYSRGGGAGSSVVGGTVVKGRFRLLVGKTHAVAPVPLGLVEGFVGPAHQRGKRLRSAARGDAEAGGHLQAGEHSIHIACREQRADGFREQPRCAEIGERKQDGELLAADAPRDAAG